MNIPITEPSCINQNLPVEFSHCILLLVCCVDIRCIILISQLVMYSYQFGHSIFCFETKLAVVKNLKTYSIGIGLEETQYRQDVVRRWLGGIIAILASVSIIIILCNMAFGSNSSKQVSVYSIYTRHSVISSQTVCELGQDYDHGDCMHRWAGADPEILQGGWLEGMCVRNF